MHNFLPVLALVFNAFVWGVSWWPFRQLHGAGVHPLWATALVFTLAVVGLLLARPGVYLVGQITGVEGYVESAASGLWLGMLLDARARGHELPPPPVESALGGLLNHLRTPVKHFQPSNAHFGLVPELGEKARKKDRKALYSARAQECFGAWLAEVRQSGAI